MELLYLCIFKYLEDFAIGFGLFFCFLLLFLAWRYTRKEVGAYKFLIMLFSINGIAYLVILIFFRERIVTQGHIFALFSVGLLGHLERAPVIYCCAYTVNFILIDYHFLYRFWAVKNPTLIRYFHKSWFILLLFLGAVLEVTAWYLLCVFTYVPTEDGLKELEPFIRTKYGLDVYALSFIMADYIRDGLPNWLALGGFCGFGVIMVLCFGFMVYCGVASASFLNGTNLISPSSKRLHVQLLRILIIQTAVPFLLYYLPGSLNLTCPIFGVELGLFGDVVTTLSCMHPLVDALVVIILMKDYRHGLLRLLGCPHPNASKQSLPSLPRSRDGSKESGSPAIAFK